MGAGIGISVTLSGFSRLFGDDLSGVVEAAVIAEASGIDQIVLPDHLGIGPHTDRYPYGRFPFGNDEPWLEPLTTLAAIAGATKQIRLGTGVLIAPLRPALLLAKTLATLDVLSRGRVDLGVGIGWQPEEFAASGVPFEGRLARMDDTLRACRVLWSEAPASFRSPTVSFENLWCLPKPMQRGGIPLWFGVALTERNLARIVEFGAGWTPVAAGLEEVAEGARRLRDAFAKAGRHSASVRVRAGAPIAMKDARTPDLDRTFASLPTLRDAGVTTASFALPRFARKSDEVRPFLERLGKLTS